MGELFGIQMMHKQQPKHGSNTLVSPADKDPNISHATTSLQSLNLSSQRRNSQVRLPPIEEGSTTVERAKPYVNFASLKSSQLGIRAPTQAFGSQAGFASGPRRMDLAWRKPNLSGQHFAPPRNLGEQSTAAISGVSHYQNIGEKGQFKTTYKTNDSCGASQNVPKVYRKEWFKPGIIIRANLHEDDFRASNATMTAGHTVMNGNAHKGSNVIFSKERKMIVVACYAQHYVAIPLFTHEGRGLENKHQEEYVSVRDHRDRSPGFKELSSHGSLATEYITPGIQFFHLETTAHITYPLSRRYDFAAVDEGRLGPEAIGHLVNLFNQYAPALL